MISIFQLSFLCFRFILEQHLFASELGRLSAKVSAEERERIMHRLEICAQVDAQLC